MTDREFRKIPSLKFLYEVSDDGRIFRNVKSKRQLKIHSDIDGNRYVIVPSIGYMRVIDALKETHSSIQYSIVLYKNGQSQTFPSIKAAARWLSQTCNTSEDLMRSKLKQRRHHIHGYDVIFLNVETACAHPTG